MIRLIRKNQKKALALFGALLMVAFIIPQFGRPSYEAPVFGTIGEEKLLLSDSEAAAREWTYLNQTKVSVRGNGQADDEMRLSEYYFRTMGAAGASIEPEDWRSYFLLTVEARRAGIVPPDQLVQQRLKSSPPSERADPETRYSAVRNMLAIEMLFDREIKGAALVSQPMAMHGLSGVETKLSVHAVFFPADKFMDMKLPATGPADAPTTAATNESTTQSTGGPSPQEQQLYERLRNQPLNSTADPEKNPLGFGYRYPDRAKIEYLWLPEQDLSFAIAPTISEWALVREYNKHPDAYPASAPSTSPSATGPATLEASTTAPATSAPATTEPAGSERMRGFTQHRDEIRIRLINTLRDRVLAEASRVILEKMSDDYTAWQKGDAPKSSPEDASFTVRYDDPAYFRSVQQHVQLAVDAKYPEFYREITGDAFKGHISVYPRSQQPDVWLDAEALSKLDGSRSSVVIGDTLIPNDVDLSQARCRSASQVDAVRQVFILGDPFITAQNRTVANRNQLPVLKVMQPSLPYVTITNTRHVRDLVFFRITEAQPAHPPASIDEVMNRVRQDLRTQQAYDRAVTVAESFAQRAAKLTLQGAANDSGNIEIKTSDTFTRDQTFSIDGLALPEKAVPEFARGAFDLVDMLVANPNPVKVIRIPAAHIVAVAAINQEKFEPLTRDEELEAHLHAAYAGTRSQLISGIAAGWFNPESIASRLNFKATRGDRQKKEDDTPPPPSPLGL